MKTRISMLHNLCVWRGGAERLIFSLSSELKRLGYDVNVYVLRYNPTKCYPEFREIKTAGASRLFGLRIFDAMPALQALELALRAPSCDIIHAHNFPANIAALMATRLNRGCANIPYLWQCNEPSRIIYDRDEVRRYRKEAESLSLLRRTTALLGLRMMHTTSRSLDMCAARNASVVTTLSRFVARIVKETYGRDAIVLNPGVDVRIFHPSVDGKTVRRRYGIAEAPLLLTVSRLWPAKNVETALEAFRIVLEDYPSAFYLVVGDGPSARDLQNLAYKLGLGQRVRFVPDDEVENLAEFYAACDIFVFPALGEPWGLSVLEAMASGKPVVAANDGGLPEIITDRRNGILVEPRNPHSYAEAIQCLLDSQSLATTLGERAANTAKTHTWERMARSYSKIYDQLLQS